MTIKSLRRLSAVNILVVIHFLSSKINIFTCKQKYTLVRTLTVLCKHERDSHLGEYEWHGTGLNGMIAEISGARLL
jgi:hypothetical protein